jgi:hypothetical protein
MDEISMRLNLPILDQLVDCKHILIVGMGGGFDIFCGLPIYFELKSRGFDVHLASLSDASLKRIMGARRLTPTLFGILPSTESHSSYFPELHLSRWFKRHLNDDLTIWCFEKVGVRLLKRNYEMLVNYLSTDAIVLIDGGVDSLMRGDEYETGSVVEDGASLAAVNELTQIPVRMTACLGFGAELEVSHAHIFENIANLTQENAFLGSCSLTPQMEVYQKYEQALLFAQEQQRQDASVINSSVVSATRGHYGDYHLTSKTRDSGRALWISPLMPLYWFFDLATVARHNLFMDAIKETETFEDVRHRTNETLKSLHKRPKFQIPLG